MNEEAGLKELPLSSSLPFPNYMALLENILLVKPKKYETSAIAKELSRIKNAFSSPDKFEKLTKSFGKIFDRKTGLNKLSVKEKEALTKWYGLKEGGKTYWEVYGVVGGSKKLGEEMGVTPTKAGRLVGRAMVKLRKAENFELFPEEVKPFLRT